jgi:outer membrane cobalamin receptor
MLFAAAMTLQADSVRVCMRDQVTDAPVIAVTVISAGRSRFLADDCGWLPAGRTTIRRIGYRQLVVDVVNQSIIRLVPLAGSSTVLDTQRVVARMDGVAASRTGMALTTAAAREQGVATVSQLVARLPYTQLQSNRGSVTLSLRGARREQVVVTLDGVPLNDPSTGLADISELPMSAVSAAAVSPGASPIVDGSGAIGGVLALQSNGNSVLNARYGALGERGVEMAGRLVTGNAIVHAGASWGARENAFRFRNLAGAFETAPVEVRQNNDERRMSAFGSVLRGGLRVAAMASHIDRGMVGPMNVRTYDNDRARTERLMVDARLQHRSVLWSANVRTFDLAYRDESRPQLDNDARAEVATVGASGAIGSFTVAAGASADRVATSIGVRQGRVRGYVSTQRGRTIGGATITAGGRVDAVEHSGVLPSFSVAAAREWQQQRWSGVLRPGIRARIAQAVRVPTLYDLYFASPQRIVLRKLEPERVIYDAEVVTSVQWQRGEASVLFEGALVARQLRDAIIWFPGNFSWSPANVGEERLRGAEARMHAGYGRAHLSAWMSWYDPELTSGTLDIPTPYVARHSAGSQVSGTVRAFTVSSALRAIGRRPFTNGPRNPRYELPAVALVDVSVAHRSHTSRTSLLLSASLENVADRPWQSVHGFPEPGRRWSLSLTLTPRQ